MHTIFALPLLALLSAAHPVLFTSPHPIDTRSLHNLYFDIAPSALAYAQPGGAHLSKQFATQTVGSITIGSSSKNVPHHVRFSLAPATCAPLADEISCLVKDLSTRVLEQYQLKGPSHCRKLEESVSLMLGEREFGATVEIEVEGGSGSGRVSKREMESAVEALTKAVVAVEDEKTHQGMAGGMGSIVTMVEGLSARWTFYEVVNGAPVKCS